MRPVRAGRRLLVAAWDYTPGCGRTCRAPSWQAERDWSLSHRRLRDKSSADDRRQWFADVMVPYVGRTHNSIGRLEPGFCFAVVRSNNVLSNAYAKAYPVYIGRDRPRERHPGPSLGEGYAGRTA